MPGTNLTGASSTPQPWRKVVLGKGTQVGSPDKGKPDSGNPNSGNTPSTPSQDQQGMAQIIRNAQESERWDDLLAPIYKDQEHNNLATWNVFNTSRWLRSVQITMPIVGRIEVTGWWSPQVVAGSNLTILLATAVAAIVGGQANTAGSESTSAVTSTGGYVNVFHNDTFDVNPGIYKVGTIIQLLTGGSGSLVFEDSGMTARRGRKPVS